MQKSGKIFKNNLRSPGSFWRNFGACTPAEYRTKALGRLAADKLIELIEHPRVTLPEQIRVSGKLLDGGSVRIL